MGYTKGPWVATLGMSGLIRGIRGEGGKNVVNFNGISAPASEEGQDNARLIAAAPELLEAARQALSDLEWIEKQKAGTNMQASILILRAAIAKAEGK